MESSSYCLGCGSPNVPAYNRRKLSSEVSGDVKDAWKSALVDEYGDYISVAAGDDDTIIAILKESGGYMCRPCFTTFERFHNLKCRISDSIKGLDDKITAVPIIRHNTKLRRIDHFSEGNNTPLNIQLTTTKSSPGVSVLIGEGCKRKLFPITPNRKKIVKALARRSYKSVAENAWSNETARKYLKRKFCVELKKEIKKMLSHSTNSVLQNSDIDSFSWEAFEKELQENSPLFYNILFELTSTRSTRPNRSNVICVCAAMILKFRYSKMSVIHKIISAILLSGHCSKQTFDRLHCLGLCMSYMQTHRIVTVLSANQDAKVRKWRSNLIDEARFSESHLSNAFLDNSSCDVEDDNESMSTDDSDIDFMDTVDGDRGSETSDNMQSSPITSSDESELSVSLDTTSCMSHHAVVPSFISGTAALDVTLIYT